MEDGRRHPQVVEWMWLESKKLVGYLQIYDTGQHEAWLHWLLLKEFVHLERYPLSKGMKEDEVWQDTCIIGQQRVWMHGVDLTFISFIMSSSHELYDESMRRQKTLLLLGLFLREKRKIFSHMLYDVAGVGDGTIMVQRGYSLALDEQEVLPFWEEFPNYSNIVGGVFDKDYFKEMSYGLA